MEYVKGSPYFCQTKTKLRQYPYLDKKLNCEILIIGGGIDGAIANFYLSKNHDFVLVPDKRLIFGGEDTKFNNKGINYKFANKKYKSLLLNLKELFSEFSEQIEIEKSFCGSFGATNNNLGLIGGYKRFVLFYKLWCKWYNKCNVWC